MAAAGREVAEYLCALAGICPDGRDGVGLSGADMVHGGAAGWLRHHAGEEGLLVPHCH